MRLRRDITIEIGFGGCTPRVSGLLADTFGSRQSNDVSFMSIAYQFNRAAISLNAAIFNRTRVAVGVPCGGKR